MQIIPAYLQVTNLKGSLSRITIEWGRAIVSLNDCKSIEYMIKTSSKAPVDKTKVIIRCQIPNFWVINPHWVSEILSSNLSIYFINFSETLQEENPIRIWKCR